MIKTVIARLDRATKYAAVSRSSQFLWNTGSPGPGAQLRTRPGDDSGEIWRLIRAAYTHMTFTDFNFQTARIPKHGFAISRRDPPELCHRFP
jgi:hypothetical protein